MPFQERTLRLSESMLSFSEREDTATLDELMAAASKPNKKAVTASASGY